MGPSTPTARSEPPLIGRTLELRAADRWLSLAEDGVPRLGLVRGATGTGKTRLLREVVARAEDAGFRVLYGAGDEERTPPPLLPMLSALRPLLDQAAAGLRPDLAPGDLAALGLGAAAPDAAGGSAPQLADTARHLATARLLLGAARAGPVLLALDDVHALDDASAAMLAHLVAAAAHDAEGAPVQLLTVAVVRTGAGTPAGSRLAARLRDEPGSEELPLGGLHEVGVHELLHALGPARPSRAVVRAVVERTDGNPLFARLLWAHLLDSGAAAVVGDRVVLDDPAAAQVARLRLDDVVDLRLDQLQPDTLDLLQVAAVVGGGSELDVLATVAGVERREVERLLVPAEDAGVCELLDEHFRFDHPLVAAALSRRFSLGERRRLHHLTAEALASADAPPELRIAAHLRAAGPLAPPAARATWGARAGRRALELGAWGDAAAAYELALAATPDLDDADLLRLRLEATLAHHLDHDLEGCERHAVAAVALARRSGDVAAWCEAVTLLGRTRVRLQLVGSRTPSDVLDEFLAEAPDAPPALRARVLAVLAEVQWAAFEIDEARASAGQARRLAAEAADDDLEAFAAFVEGLQLQGAFDLDGADEAFADGHRHAVRAGNAAVAAWTEGRSAAGDWQRGALARARQRAEAAEVAAAERQDWTELSLMAAWQSAIAASQARYGDAVRLAERALAFHRRTGYSFAAMVANPVLAAALAIRGDVTGAHGVLDAWRRDGATRNADRLDVLVDALVGDRAAVAAAVEEGRWRPVAVRRPDFARAAALVHQVELAEVAGRPDLAAPLAEPLASVHGDGVRFVPGSVALLSRVVGQAVAAGGDLEGALAWLEAARHEARAVGARGELARCDLATGAVLAAAGRARPAERYRARAAAALDRLDMVGLLRVAERALDGAPSGGRRAHRVVLFTDLVGSTELNAVAGDEDYHRLLRAHDRATRTVIEEHDGVAFKHTGDGVAAWFSSSTRAVECALTIAERVASLVHPGSGVALAVRCGLAAGEPIVDDGDLFGLAVSRAARICDQAGGGEVLVGDEVASTVVGDRVRFERPRDVQLKGLPRPHRLLVAERGLCTT